MTTKVSSTPLSIRVGLDLGLLEEVDDAVAEEDRVGQGFERHACSEPGISLRLVVPPSEKTTWSYAMA